MDPILTPFNGRSMPNRSINSCFPSKWPVTPTAVSGLFGIILASVGLARVTAYSVRQRRRRPASVWPKGAKKGEVLRLVMKEGAVLIAIGLTLGWPDAGPRYC